MSVSEEKRNPFASFDNRRVSTSTTTTNEKDIALKDADEALSFLENHPNAAEIAIEGNAILEDPVRLKKLVRKIDLTIAPLLAIVYFLQFLDKTTLSYTSVMGIRTDTHLKGQNYSDLSMLFYIGMCDLIIQNGYWNADFSGLFLQAFLRQSSLHSILRSTWHELGCTLGRIS
jgi:MFS transporter, ACS family, allantoate permease